MHTHAESPYGVLFLYSLCDLPLNYNLLQSSSNSVLATLDCQNNYSQQNRLKKLASMTVCGLIIKIIDTLYIAWI